VQKFRNTTAEERPFMSLPDIVGKSFALGYIIDSPLEKGVGGCGFSVAGALIS
jgi:hypothetical protein